MQTQAFKFRNINDPKQEILRYSKSAFEELEMYSPMDSRLGGFLEKTKTGYFAHLDLDTAKTHIAAEQVGQNPYAALDLVVVEMKKKLQTAS